VVSSQTEAGPVIAPAAEGTVLTTTVVVAVAVQALAAVASSVYTPLLAVVAFGMLGFAPVSGVAPNVHANVIAPVDPAELRLIVPPLHTGLLLEATAIGLAFTTTVAGLPMIFMAHPCPSVEETIVYVVVTVGVTKIVVSLWVITFSVWLVVPSLYVKVNGLNPFRLKVTAAVEFPQTPPGGLFVVTLAAVML
jgi:hypothetical protein